MRRVRRLRRPQAGQRVPKRRLTRFKRLVKIFHCCRAIELKIPQSQSIVLIVSNQLLA